MNIIVCVKQVIDPEAPPASFKIDTENKQVIQPQGVSQVISPFDEQAVEAALRLKDSLGGKITVLSLGNDLLRDVVKKPLAALFQYACWAEAPPMFISKSAAVAVPTRANVAAPAIRPLKIFFIIVILLLLCFLKLANILMVSSMKADPPNKT